MRIATGALSCYNRRMKLHNLLLAIGVAILAFWLLSIIFKVLSWLIHVALFVGLVLIIASLLQKFFADRSDRPKKLG